MGSLTGKVALIIGASTPGGIGAVTGARFVRDGARVVVSARRLAEAEAQARSFGATALACDMTDDAQVEALMQAVVARHGKLDVLVIVAGAHASQVVDQLTRETLLRCFELNVVGPASAIKHAARVMQKGSIIYVSSAAAELNTIGVSAYGATKAAGERLVEVAALEYAPRGIRINTLAPGMLETSMSEAAMKRPGFKRAFERETPLGRIARVEEVAAAAAYLASDDCFTTGDKLRVAGGVHLRRHPMPEDFKPD